MARTFTAEFAFRAELEGSEQMAVEAVSGFAADLHDLIERHGLRLVEREGDVRRGQGGKVLWRDDA